MLAVFILVALTAVKWSTVDKTALFLLASLSFDTRAWLPKIVGVVSRRGGGDLFGGFFRARSEMKYIYIYMPREATARFSTAPSNGEAQKFHLLYAILRVLQTGQCLRVDRDSCEASCCASIQRQWCGAFRRGGRMVYGSTTGRLSPAPSGVGQVAC